MKKIVKAILVMMSIATVIWLIYIGRAFTTSNAGKFYWSGKYYLATFYEGAPNEWLHPKDLGIIQIIERNATALAVSIPTELDPGDLEIRRPIFKYKDRFYQIQYAELRWDAFQEETRGILISTGAVATGWLLTGILTVRGGKESN